MSDKIKFAVIGCGHIGKRHAEMIQRNPESELVAMCDIVSKEDADIDRFNVNYYQSVEELLKNEASVNVVTICTPNGLHAEQSLSALEHNKHVVIEKPMGLSKKKCEEIIFKSLRNNKQVFCVMQNRYSPPSEWIKKVVRRWHH
jgi:UDP-N-acetyl-2-amino-2-deoxyglucuronate dehydrogenase